MNITDTNIEQESQDRYLTYALSVITGRALPDVRDGLKPVQRRILYAAYNNLRLLPGGGHRKSAAVVGEVLAKYHPHGDLACYEAMVRMAQDFSLRYPLIDGQGNFGSIDGDSPAAYRYTEVKLRPLALEVLEELQSGVVSFRDTFDASNVEPMVLPSRVPLLIVNGASGIAVGMATNIPPHNLRDTVRALIELSRNPSVSDARLAAIIKGPDFPTGCSVVSSKKELAELYRTGRGSVRMRGDWRVEDLGRGKKAIIVTSIPYGVVKSQLVEKIATLIIERRVPQLIDVRDESTTDVRLVLELKADASAEVAMAYLYRHTPLESSFAANFTALVPTDDGGLRPELVSLKQALGHFLSFRVEMTRGRLMDEQRILCERVHILDGLLILVDHINAVIRIVQKSSGRKDAALKLRERFSLSEVQAYAVVDMRIYQLSQTSLEELVAERTVKQKRIDEISAILSSSDKVREIVETELEELGVKFGDKRRSSLRDDEPELSFDESLYVVQEDVLAIVTRDGWLKRIRAGNDVSQTRLREGDSLLAVHETTTRSSIALFTSFGRFFTVKVTDFPASGGFGVPVQKLLKFDDNERLVSSAIMASSSASDVGVLQDGSEVFFVTKQGLGLRCCISATDGSKRSGKRLVRVRDGDVVVGVASGAGSELLIVTGDGRALRLACAEVPTRGSGALGVTLIKVSPGYGVVGLGLGGPESRFVVTTKSERREFLFRQVEFGQRAKNGVRLPGVAEVTAFTLLGEGEKLH